MTILKSYQPVSVGIFGSFARNESTEKSDIDILVKFKVAPSLLTLIKLENELSELLGIREIEQKNERCQTKEGFKASKKIF